MRYLRFFVAISVFFLVQGCTKSEVDTLEKLPFTLAPALNEIQINNSRYITDFPLDTTHYITLPVDVHRTGLWSFSTDTLNGIRFTGSGTFSDTGRHTIKLMAEGTPNRICHL